ncbi:MAG: DUF4011 domain-containing protein, partial [Thermoplasmatales archaeon]
MGDGAGDQSQGQMKNVSNPDGKDADSAGLSDCKKVFDKIDQWKNELIDFSRKNKLLFLKEDNKDRIEITHPHIFEIFDSLVVREKSLYFPKPPNDPQNMDLNDLGNYKIQEDSTLNGDIKTNQPIEKLQLILRKMRRNELTFRGERGIRTLFFAMGFLKWSEKQTSGRQNEYYLMPIFLVPVDLERNPKKNQFFIKLGDDDIIVNPALVFKLERDFKISLPQISENFDSNFLSSYFEELEIRVREFGWNVVKSGMLGMFHYEKFVMYDDLEDHKKQACNHPIIRALSKSQSFSEENNIQFPHNLDEVVDPKEIFPILDADSSQMEALLRFKRGQNLVIQGPPGTGKSQTIVNLITQALREGKKVLFVSEKMAALDVVYKRLQECGLSFACLEIHDPKSDKLRVVQELATTLSQTTGKKVDPALNEKYQRLTVLRDRLNNYVLELHKVRGGLKLSAYQVYGKLQRLKEVPKIEFRLPIEPIMDLRDEQLNEIMEALHRIVNIDAVYDNYENHPWNGVILKTVDDSGLPIDPSIFVDDVSGAINFLLADLNEFQYKLEAAASKIGVAKPLSILETEKFMKIIELLSNPEEVMDTWIGMSRDDLNKLTSDCKELQNLNELVLERKRQLNKYFNLDLLNQPIEEILGRFQRDYASPMRFFKSQYRREMKELKLYSNVNVKIKYGDVLKSLIIAKELTEFQKKLEEDYLDAKKFLGLKYNKDSTDWISIFSCIDWLVKLQSVTGGTKLPDQLKELLQNRGNLSQWVKTVKPGLEESLSRIISRTKKIEWAMSSYTIEGGNFASATFSNLESWLRSKQDREHLRNWLLYQKALENCDRLGLSSFMAAARMHKIKSDKLKSAFMERLWKTWLSEAYRESPLLSEFMTNSYERDIVQFRNLDKELRKFTVEVIKQEIMKRQHLAENNPLNTSQKNVILHESRKKKRIAPLRKIFSLAPQLIQDLKPCMLMSPLSIASYLGNSPFNFDLVIFDEASQMSPADSIGAILRGSQLVVVGDDKQLPPTNFFKVEIDFEDDENDITEEPLESILDECLTLPTFKRVFLKWHYRSRREELIDFSNKNFYDGQLVTFPSPDSRDAAPAIEFKHVPDGIYDRGASRTNIKEANVVCDLIEEHFRKCGGNLTLGVITLGESQEEAILNEFERRKIRNPELESLSVSNKYEPFFVKSIENVQGDERDVIIISLCYGRDKNGVISLNFGPINKAGGERRLNVAITRARVKIIFVSSILPYEMDL